MGDGDASLIARGLSCGMAYLIGSFEWGELCRFSLALDKVVGKSEAGKYNTSR